ncbi:hypothetical protein ABKN59_005905 [Abortiporus biennis]
MTSRSDLQVIFYEGGEGNASHRVSSKRSSKATASGNDSEGSSKKDEPKLGPACAECRRSKLRCDRLVPCNGCIRRGCPSICPNGKLSAREGSRAMTERNQQLYIQVQSLKAKVKQLEEELAAARISTASNVNASTSRSTPTTDHTPPPPTPPSFDDSSTPESEESSSSWKRDVSSSEFLNVLVAGRTMDEKKDRQRDPKFMDFPFEILQLIAAFPFGIRHCPCDISIFVPFIPPRDTAKMLVQRYYECAGWQSEPVTYEEFNAELFDVLYKSYPRPPSVDRLHPHQLAFFFSIMAYGAFHLREPSDPTTTQERYHALACGVFSMSPMKKDVTIWAIQTLFITITFLYNAVSSASEEFFLLFGVAVRAANMLRLQWDAAEAGYSKQDVQKRRRLFWEMYVWDTWGSFIMGQPPQMHLEDSDCKFPENDIFPGQDPSETGWHLWKAKYSAALLPPTLKYAYGHIPSNVSYGSLLDLAKKIRAFPVSSHLRAPLGPDPQPWNEHPRIAARQYSVFLTVESHIMYLHRTYFAIAMQESATDPLQHEYGSSVVTSQRCACRIWKCLKDLHGTHPESLRYVWYFWSGLYSACVLLAAVVIGSPGCSLAEESYKELSGVYDFYVEFSTYVRPDESMVILTDLKQRAQAAYEEYRRENQTLDIELNSRSTSPGPTDPTRSPTLTLLEGHSTNNTFHPSYHSSPPLVSSTIDAYDLAEAFEEHSSKETAVRMVAGEFKLIYWSGMSGNGGKDSNGNGDTFKERRNKLACAECRRSKLKCDRIVPCQACVRRGCASLCPDGTLAATKGNKALQQRNERLEETIKDLRDKVKQLERNLAQATGAPVPSDAEEKDNLEVNLETDTGEDTKGLVEAIGSLAINEEGESKYYGSTSSSEFLSGLLPGQETDDHIFRQRDAKNLDIPVEIIQLIYAFPLGLRDCPYDISIFLSFIPSADLAKHYIDLHYEFAAWQFDPFPSAGFYRDIYNVIYPPGSDKPCLDKIHPHQLALFFSIMAHGVFFARDKAMSVEAQERYHALACGAFSMSPFIRGVKLASVHALFSINRFLYYTVRSAVEDWFIIIAVTARAAQVMGLHCDGSFWGLEPEEIQLRRSMFWELYVWDAWGSLTMGRPPAISLEYVDCKFPENDVVPGQSSSELGWHQFKMRFTMIFMPTVLKHAFIPTASSYKVLLDLEKRIRAYPVPVHLQSPFCGTENRSWSGYGPNALKQYNVLIMKEATPMYLHRTYLAIALRESPTDPLKHKFGGSVLASYRSGRCLWLALKDLNAVHPKPCSHFWFFWSTVYSVAVMFAAIVIGSPGCSIADEAFRELNNACDFYEAGSAHLRPPKSMTVLADFRHKARVTFEKYHSAMNSNQPTAAEDLPEIPGLDVVGGSHQVIRHTSESPAHSPHNADNSNRKASRKSSRKSLSPRDAQAEGMVQSVPPVAASPNMMTPPIKVPSQSQSQQQQPSQQQTPLPSPSSWYAPPETMTVPSQWASSNMAGPSSYDGLQTFDEARIPEYIPYQHPQHDQSMLQHNPMHAAPADSSLFMQQDPTGYYPYPVSETYESTYMQTYPPPPPENGMSAFPDYGQNHEIWSSFLEGLMSQPPQPPPQAHDSNTRGGYS